MQTNCLLCQMDLVKQMRVLWRKICNTGRLRRCKNIVGNRKSPTFLFLHKRILVAVGRNYVW